MIYMVTHLRPLLSCIDALVHTPTTARINEIQPSRIKGQCTNRKGQLRPGGNPLSSSVEALKYASYGSGIERRRP